LDLLGSNHGSDLLFCENSFFQQVAWLPTICFPWSVTGSLNTPRHFHTATRLTNGKVLVVGGQDADDSAELYDPATGSFRCCHQAGGV
jgi:hypothetical protein